LGGRSVLVTGGSHGIGLASARLFADLGCRVAICSRSRERLDAAERDLAARGAEVLAVQADMLESGHAERVAEAVLKQFGTLSVLVNNVGGGGRWGKPSIEETDEKVWYEVYEKNAMTAVRMTRLFLPGMRAQKWGRVVTVGSILGKEGGGRPWFNMAKAAEISLMKCLGLMPELARDGITFNTVAPGKVLIPDTGWEEMLHTDPEAFASACDDLPMGRMGTPEEVANVIVFLSSAAASWVSGSVVTVDGCETHSF
jgi:Dehydrogenases with different specificities (related to short-chain alcohol dehydrogenases)